MKIPSDVPVGHSRCCSSLRRGIIQQILRFVLVCAVKSPKTRFFHMILSTWKVFTMNLQNSIQCIFYFYYLRFIIFISLIIHSLRMSSELRDQLPDSPYICSTAKLKGDMEISTNTYISSISKWTNYLNIFWSDRYNSWHHSQFMSKKWFI